MQEIKQNRPKYMKMIILITHHSTDYPLRRLSHNIVLYLPTLTNCNRVLV